jgi:hypothetical protein
MEVLSTEEEAFTFDVPDQEPRESKYYFAAGKYRGRLVDIEKSTSKKSGDPMIVLTFLLLEGPGQGVDFKTFLPVTGKMFWKVEEAATALGVPFEKGSKNISFSRAQLVNKDVTLDLGQTQYNGRDKMEIRKILKAESTF